MFFNRTYEKKVKHDKKINTSSRNKGITLIALVVTIIVLLILAGISINMLTGENGIIKRAGEAKEKTDESSGLEYLQTEAYSALLSYYGNNNGLNEEEYVLQELKKLDGVETNETTGTITYNGKTYNISQIIGNSKEQTILANNGLTQVLDSELLAGNNIRMVIEEKTENGKVQAVIPVGFYYVGGSITGGLVISDVEGDDLNNSKGGNQFVWVPCNQEGMVEYEQHVYTTEKVDDTTETITDTENGNWKTYYYRNYDDWSDEGGNETSVTKYGGFYIARYEAGTPIEAPFYNNTDKSTYWQTSYSEDVTEKYGSNDLTTEGETTNYADTYMDKNVTTYVPISKKNTPAWNFISQTTAKEVSSKMYEESTSVTSSLVDSYAWDTVTQWLYNAGYNVTNSTTWGNYYDSSFEIMGLYAKHEYKLANDNVNRWFPAYYYSYGTYEKSNRERTETATGSIEKNIANNIYDLAGNMWEWTTEIGKHNVEESTTTYAVLRGGSFYYNGSSSPVCYRHGNSASSWTYPYVGFRVVLYIK